MRKKLLMISLILSIATVCFAYTRDWDNASPVDHTLNKNWPGEDRKIRVDVEERLDDIMDGFTAGDTVTRFNRVPYYVRGADDTGVADTIILYGKDVSAKTELFSVDEDDNVIQITTGGVINAAPRALTDGQIFVGNGSGVATDVALTGDVSITNAGVSSVTDLTIASEAQGDIVIRGAASWERLAKGTAYQTTRMNAGATAQEYVDEQGFYDYSTSTSASTQKRASTILTAYGTTGSIADNGTTQITNLPFTSAATYVMMITPDGTSTTNTFGGATNRDSGAACTITNKGGGSQTFQWFAFGT